MEVYLREANTDYIETNHSSQEQYTPACEGGQSQSATMLRRIGTTNYRVRVHFSDTSTETVNDKILRLVKNEGVME